MSYAVFVNGEMMMDLIAVMGGLIFFSYAVYWAIKNPRDKND